VCGIKERGKRLQRERVRERESGVELQRNKPHPAASTLRKAVPVGIMNVCVTPLRENVAVAPSITCRIATNREKRRIFLPALAISTISSINHRLSCN
jgi:hypothetical protein